MSEVQHDFGSILHYVETTFNLGTLGTSDSQADDLNDCFNFGAPPRAFTVISAPPFTPGQGPSADAED